MTNPETRTPIALVVSDIDGTLITSNHELTEATKQAAARLYDRGVQLSLASSRPARSIRPLAEALGLRSPFAAFNGALVVTADGSVMARSIIEPEITAHIKAIADELGIGVWLYDETEWYVRERNAFVDREEHTSGFAPDIDDYDKRLNDAGQQADGRRQARACRRGRAAGVGRIARQSFGVTIQAALPRRNILRHTQGHCDRAPRRVARRSRQNRWP